MKQKSTQNLIKKWYLLLFFLLVNFITFSQTEFYQGSLNQTSWNNLISEISTKTETLKSKINEAEIANLETSYANGTLITVNEFLTYASRDREKASELQTIYEAKTGGFQSFNKNFNRQIIAEGIAGSPKYANFHPFQQLHGCVKILDNAINEITKQINKEIILPKTIDFTTSGNPQLMTNSSYYKKNGRVIFPSTFWGMPENDPSLMETVGYLGSTFMSPANTDNLVSPGNVKRNHQLGQTRLIARQIAAKQTPTQIHFTHTQLPNYIKTTYPDIDKYRRAFVHYDIDHPVIKNTSPGSVNIVRNMVTSYVSAMKNSAGNAPLVYVMSNEPHWDIATNSTVDANRGVSSHTLNEYVKYLKNEYGTINNLNTVYNPFNGKNTTNDFNNFNELKTAYTIPLDPEANISSTNNSKKMQGSPIWYDWLRFNMNRANTFHDNLKSFFRQADSNAKVSIKVLGREVEDPREDGGIDLEHLMDIQDIIGFDNQVVPNETHTRFGRFYKEWKNNYILDWREQSISLDFAKSLYPNKPIFDSEWHGISSNAWVNFTLDSGYVRSGLWLAFTNGLSMINNWWWYRENKKATRRRPDGTSFVAEKGDLQGKKEGNVMFSVQHQPIAFDMFGRTMKELNANSNTVTSLVPEERDFLIYYCDESAIQDFEYAQQNADVYEALKLMNVKVGFTTPNKINSLGYKPKAIIIPPTLYGLDSSLDALKSFKANNPSVDILQVSRSGNDVKNFERDEKGTPDDSRNLNFINKTVTFSSNIISLINRLKGNLALPSSPINVKITVPGSANEAFGVFVSQGSTPNGSHAISLINVSLNNREIELPRSTNFVNLLDGKSVNSSFIMKPYDVLLIAESSVSNTTKSNKNKVKTFSVYPNPAKGVLNIVNDITGKYTIYNVNGAVISSINSKKKSFQINVDNLSSGLYFIELPTNEGKQVKTIIISN